MASVRKRTWASGGEKREAWVADYFDQAGKRHIKTFERKKDADAWLDNAKAEVRTGTHTPDSTSRTRSTTVIAGEAAQSGRSGVPLLWAARGAKGSGSRVGLQGAEEEEGERGGVLSAPARGACAGQGRCERERCSEAGRGGGAGVAG